MSLVKLDSKENYRALVWLYRYILCRSVPLERGTSFREWRIGRPIPDAFRQAPWKRVVLADGERGMPTGKVSSGDPVALAVFFAGIAAISIMASAIFAKKDARWRGETRRQAPPTEE